MMRKIEASSCGGIWSLAPRLREQVRPNQVLVAKTLNPKPYELDPGGSMGVSGSI